VQTSYLWIDDKQIEIRAEQLWGKETYQTQAAIKRTGASRFRSLASARQGGLIPFALIL
jgi:aldehyde:ferredoxin oxidoreductase